jgi:hypothetical protein
MNSRVTSAPFRGALASATQPPRFVKACEANHEQKAMMRRTVRANEGSSRGRPTYDRCVGFNKR